MWWTAMESSSPGKRAAAVPGPGAGGEARQEEGPIAPGDHGPLRAVPGHLSRAGGHQPRAGKEIQLTDALQRLARQRAVYAYQFESERYDAGTLRTWLETTITLTLRDPELGPWLRDFLRKTL